MAALGIFLMHGTPFSPADNEFLVHYIFGSSPQSEFNTGSFAAALLESTFGTAIAQIKLVSFGVNNDSPARQELWPDS